MALLRPIAQADKRPKIAIVDDDASLRSKLASGFRAEFEILEGDNYKTAYKFLQQDELDVLLLGFHAAAFESLNFLVQADASTRSAAACQVRENGGSSFAGSGSQPHELPLPEVSSYTVAGRRCELVGFISPQKAFSWGRYTYGGAVTDDRLVDFGVL
jgi:hypothetical protein